MHFSDLKSDYSRQLNFQSCNTNCQEIQHCFHVLLHIKTKQMQINTSLSVQKKKC